MTLPIEYGSVEPVRVYFDDLDAMGVLYNMRYGQLVERALTTYWERRGWNQSSVQPDPGHGRQLLWHDRKRRRL